MACTAESEQLVARETNRVADRLARGRGTAGLDSFNMPAPRAVAGFASDALFVRGQFESRAERERPRGMALEAAHDGRIRAERLVIDTQCIFQGLGWLIAMTGRGRERIRLGVVAEMVLQIPVLVRLSNESHGLSARSEGPFKPQPQLLAVIADLYAESLLVRTVGVSEPRRALEPSARSERCREPVFAGRRQRIGMTAGRLASQLVRVTGAALLGSDEIFPREIRYV